MKRTVTMIIILMLLLCSCGSADQRGADARTIDTNRSFTHYNQIIMAAETADTIYFISRTADSFIKYVDKATGISGLLCGKAECEHNNDSCNAHIGGTTILGLFVYGERLYWLNSGSPRSGMPVYSMALDGTDHREVTVLTGELVPNAGSINTVLYDGCIYTGGIKTIIEDGGEVRYNYVYAIPLDSKEEPFVVLQEKTDFNNYLSMQPYENELYIITDDLSGTLEHAQETGRWRYHFRLRRWNMESCELETLYDEDESALACPKELWVMDDGVLFCGYSDELGEMRIYKYHFESGECSYQFSTGITGLVLSGIMDNVVAGYDLTNNNGIYDMRTVIKDFNGNTLVNETYTFDLRDECLYYNRYEMDMLGRDETNVYYSLFTTQNNNDNHGLTKYITIIAVALDGSGAKVLCTEIEYL